jgi:hypothetical protein
MFKTLTAGDHSLDSGDTVVWPAARDLVLSCSAGTLWVTLDGDRRDFVLGVGESLEIASNALVVVNALKPSRLAVRLRTPSAPKSPCLGHVSALRG